MVKIGAEFQSPSRDSGGLNVIVGIRNRKWQWGDIKGRGGYVVERHRWYSQSQVVLCFNPPVGILVG